MQIERRWKTCILYLWSSHHTLSAGVYRLAPGYAAVDLGWAIDRWRAAFKLIENEGLIKSNSETNEVLICDYLTLIKPPNSKTAWVVKKQIANVSCPVLRELASGAFNLLDQQKKSSEVDESTVPAHLNTDYLKQTKK